jgi:hypothetical protein
MDNDRLLTNKECTDAIKDFRLHPRGSLDDHEHLCKAQDAKPVRELIKWLFEPCGHADAQKHGLFSKVDIIPYSQRRYCPSCMAELKEKVC